MVYFVPNEKAATARTLRGAASQMACLRSSSQWTLSWREMDSNFRFRNRSASVFEEVYRVISVSGKRVTDVGARPNTRRTRDKATKCKLDSRWACSHCREHDPEKHTL